MRINKIYGWLIQSERRKQVLLRFQQPLTAKQLSHREHLTLDMCSYHLCQLATHKLVMCLNQRARRSRVYWLTRTGQACQHRLRAERQMPRLQYGFPDVDWNLYGWVCHRHRAAIITSLVGALQPAAIKRRAKLQDSDLRMSANNTRDIIRLFLASGIVRTVRIRRKAYPRYELTNTGRDIQKLLHNASCA